MQRRKELPVLKLPLTICDQSISASGKKVDIHTHIYIHKHTRTYTHTYTQMKSSMMYTTWGSYKNSFSTSILELFPKSYLHLSKSRFKVL